jgi:uncharacterized glyoxalase superfamily protein PhnB/uncharacterized protein YndB with AHSA1/START domain
MARNAEIHPGAATAQQRIVIRRVFNAPRERVWKAWTDPEVVKQWWGPKGFTAPVSTIDLRVGGKYLSCMRSPEGKDYWSTGVYREIVPPERLVCTDNFADEKGNLVPASYYGMPGDWPPELLITVTLEEVGAKARMTLRHDGIPAGKMREDCIAGWNQSFDKLAEVLVTPTTVKAVPAGHHTVTPYLTIRNAIQALEFYQRAFGATEVCRFLMPDGRLGHAEIRLGDSLIMLSDEFPEYGGKGPQALGGSPVNLHLYVEDVDAFFKRALVAGAKQREPVKDQFYGDRAGRLEDPFGHLWWVATHKEDVSPEELRRRMQAMPAKKQ